MPRTALCLAALLLLTAPARAELIVNGGFEAPDIGTAPFTAPIGVGSTLIPGWSVVLGNVEVVSNAFSAAFEGDQWLDLIGVAPGAAQQTFATTPGETYLLSFAYANNPNASFASARVDVLGDAAAPPVLTANVTATGSTFAQMQYTVLSQPFVANSATTTLRFTSTGSSEPFSGLALDAVSVQQAIPEPSAFVLFGLGALGLAGWGWRRHRATGRLPQVRAGRVPSG